MELVVLCFVLVLQFQLIFASTISKEILDEGHAIVKRFADSNIEFTSHEIADVLHEKDTDSFHRITKRDLRSFTESGGLKRLQLDLSSGSRLHLNIKKRSLFDANTTFYTHLNNGRVKSEAPAEDCYAAGDVEEDGKSGGMVALALCNGLHGSAVSNGVEFYFHPVESSEGMHKVHILKRRASDSGTIHAINPDIFHQGPTDTIERRVKRNVTGDTYKTATNVVIEMALFVDFHYYTLLQTISPGRENEYVLMSIAAVQAIYGNKNKVGYEVRIKVKLYEVWKADPEDYTFVQDIFQNLRSFCTATISKYQYDMHFLLTGVTRQKGPAVGVAFVGGVCTHSRCANSYVTDYNRFMVTAHEMGHNLGFGHHGSSKCPKEIKQLGSGFMGGSDTLNFSPCNKWELNNFFSKGKGQCLFEETGETITSKKYVDLKSVFPGQMYTPDQQCRMRVGEGYTHYRPFDHSGKGECILFMCINLNKNSPEYTKVVRLNAELGYPCGDEMFCKWGRSCVSWDTPTVGWDADYLRDLKQSVSWSDWPRDWSECSDKCGTGVQFKRRVCKMKEGLFLSPFCRGTSIQARLCSNTQPCPGTAMSISVNRQKRGDEVCSRFKEHNVDLKLRKGSTYLNKSKQAFVNDRAMHYLETKGCFLTCLREPSAWGYLDAIFPDGTPCSETDKSSYAKNRFGITLYCVQGVCTEFSDCPGNAKKDKCGVCGGDPVNCITKQIDSSYDVAEGERRVIATIPAGSKAIDVEMKYWVNKRVKLEMVTKSGQKIFGAGGLFPKNFYKDNNPVTYAGTKWTYSYTGCIRTDGPTDQELVVIALRDIFPIKDIKIAYLLPKDG